jgi:hypothetical protein
MVAMRWSNRQYLWIKILTRPPFRSFVGAFDEFAVLECCAGTNECDQVRR